MAYYQDADDPYGPYDPQAPLDPYVTEDESFEFYDEGTDPYGEDGLYLSDGVEEYPDDGMEYEYDEMYDEEGDGMMYEDDLLFQDDWLPLPPGEIPVETLPIEQRPEDYGSQLLIGGLQHPDPASMRDSYCQFYPEACMEGAGLSGREPFNRTEVAEELDRTLKDIDMTGLAIAAVLILILLFGLHYGGATETPSPTPPASGPEKAVRDRLKEGRITDPTILAKNVSDIMKLPEDKRDAEIEKLIGEQYKKRLGDSGVTEPKLSEGVKAIMAKPAGKDRETKYTSLKAGATPAVSDEDKADKTKYDAQLRAGGIRSADRPAKLVEIMALPADQREGKCQDIINAAKSTSTPVDPDVEKYTKALEAAGFKGDSIKKRRDKIMVKPPGDRQAEFERLVAESKPNVIPPADPDIARYTEKLTTAGIKEPELTEKLNKIMALPTREERDEKFKELTKTPSTTPPVDPDKAKYEKELEASGIKEPRLSQKLQEVMAQPAAGRDTKCKDIIAKDAADALVAAAEKPMDSAALHTALKGYGYTDEATRNPLVASLRPKSLADQKKGLEDLKKAKEKEIKDREDKEKAKAALKKDLTTKLQAAGVKDPKTLDKEVARLMPLSAAEQATEIAKIKSTIDAKKASDAAKAADETLRASYDTTLKEAGYTDDPERKTVVGNLMKFPSEQRPDKLQYYIDKKKKVGQGKPSTESQDATATAEAAVKATADAAKRAGFVEALRAAGWTDQKEIDRMADALMKVKDAEQGPKLEGYKRRAPKTNSAPVETPEEIAAKAKEADKKLREELDQKLLDAKYTDKTDRDTKVNTLMAEKDPAKRATKLTDYLGRPPGSKGGPPAIANPANPADPPVIPGKGKFS
jgi:hypothetical protein